MVSGRSAHKKRPLPSSASTSTPSQSQSTSRATKRSRGQYEPLEASRVDPLPAAPLAPAPAAVPLAPIPPKRELHAGTLRRLALPRPNSTTSTLAGAKIGGKSKDLEIPKGGNSDDMYITRKGLGYGGYLKKGVTGFLQRGTTKLSMHAMGAAIPLALSLALAIRDALPGGAPTSEGVAGTVKMQVTTGTQIVSDEVTPDDEDIDLVYQTRSKSTVLIVLSVPDLMVVAQGNLGLATRGGKRHGSAMRGGRGKRGRGRGK